MKQKLKQMIALALCVFATCFGLTVQAANVAKVGDTAYETLQAALDAVAADPSNKTLTWVDETAWPTDKEAIYGDTQYATLADAILAANDANTSTAAKIFIRPYFDGLTVTKQGVTSGHIKIVTSMTIFGNNASLGSGWQPTLEYPGDAFDAGSHTLQKDVVFSVYSLHNGMGIWGRRCSDYSLTFNCANCTNAYLFYLDRSDKNGQNHFNISNVTFIVGTGLANQWPITTDSPGSVDVEGCVFQGVAMAAKGKLASGLTAGQQFDLTIKDCTFRNCTGESLAKGVIRASAQVDGTVNIVVKDCVFEGTTSGVSDITYGDGDASKSVATMNYSIKNTECSLYVTEKSSATAKINTTIEASATPVTGNNLPVAALVITDNGATTNKYYSLPEAVAAVPEGTLTTVMLAAEVVETEMVSIPADKNIILDLNGKTIKGNDITHCATNTAFRPVICNLGTLTITNGTTSAVGKIYNGSASFESGSSVYKSDWVVLVNYGDLTVKDGYIGDGSIGCSGSALVNYGNAVIDGGHLTIGNGDKSSWKYTGYTINNRNSLVINGGELYGAQRGAIGNSSKNLNWEKTAIMPAVTVINNVTITGTFYNYFVYVDCSGSGTFGPIQSSVTIKGGVFTYTPNGNNSMNCLFCLDDWYSTGNSITIEGGRFTNLAPTGTSKNQYAIYYDYADDGYFAPTAKGGVYDLDPLTCTIPDCYEVLANTPEENLWTVQSFTPVAKVVNEQKDQMAAVTSKVDVASADVYLDMWGFYGMEGMQDAQGNECPQYVPITDNTMYRDLGVEDESKAGAWVSAKYIYDNYLAPSKYYYGSQDSALYTIRDVITEKNYKTLAAAFGAVRDDEMIVVLADNSEVITTPITASSFTIDPNGFSLEGGSVQPAEGFKFVKNSDNTCTYKSIYVAQVISLDGATTNKFEDLYAAMTNATVKPEGKLVEMLQDVTVTDWTSVDFPIQTPGYVPSGTFYFDGKGHTITGLTAMFLNKTAAGGHHLRISNVTFKDANITASAWAGVVIGDMSSIDELLLTNVTVDGATVIANDDHYAGGLVGYVSGSDASVTSTFTNCKVINSHITGSSSTGGLVGHGPGGSDTIIVSDCVVSNNVIFCNEAGKTNKAGALMGTMGLGSVKASAIVCGNTVTCDQTAITTLYGRGVDNTLTLQPGGAYDTRPINEADSSWANVAEYCELVCEDGIWTVKRAFYQDPDDASLWHVTSLAGLKAFRDSVNAGTSYAGKTIRIDADIDLTGDGYWTAIKAYPGSYLAGATIDGQNHTITGMSIVTPDPESGYAYGGGFIDKTAGVLTIKDLAFADATVTSASGSQVGVVVGMTYGDVTLDNVDLSNCVVTATTKAGLLVGQNDEGTVTLRNCDVVNSQVRANYSAALLVGLLNVNNLGAVLEGNTVDEASKFVWIEGEDGRDVLINQRYYAISGSNLWLTDPGEKCLAEKREDGATVTYQGKTYNVKGSVFYPEYDFAAEISGLNLKYETLAEALAVAESGNTVKLLKDSDENVVLPTNVTLSKNGHEYTGTLTAPDGSFVKDNGDGTYTSYTQIAKIGEKAYESLAQAFAAVDDGETVKLVQAGYIAEPTLAVSCEHAFVLDLNGLTLMSDVTVSAGSMTLTNGNLKASSAGAAVTVEGGTFTLVQGAYVTGATGVAVNGGAFAAYDGFVTATNGSAVAFARGVTNYIAGGTFVASEGQKALAVVDGGTGDYPSAFIYPQMEGAAETGFPLFSSTISSDYAALGYKVRDNGNGTWTVTAGTPEIKVVVNEDIVPTVETNKVSDLTVDEQKSVSNAVADIKQNLVDTLEDPDNEDLSGTGVDDAMTMTNETGTTIMRGYVYDAITNEVPEADREYIKSNNTVTSYVKVELKDFTVTVETNTTKTTEAGARVLESTLTTIKYDIKPVVTTVYVKNDITNSVTTTIPEGTTLASPITFRLWLEETFVGSVVSVQHKHENGKLVDTKTYIVQRDEKGQKYVDLTWDQFSIALIEAFDVTGKACWAGVDKEAGDIYDTLADALTNTVANYEVFLLQDCAENDLVLKDNQTINLNGHALTGSITPEGGTENKDVVTTKSGLVYCADKAVNVRPVAGNENTLPIRGYDFTGVSEDKQTYLEALNDNGVPRWQAYVMGMDEKLLPRIVGANVGFSQVTICAQEGFTVSTPERCGVEVSFNLLKKDAGEASFTQYITNSLSPSFAVDVKDIADKTFWKIQTVFESIEKQ